METIHLVTKALVRGADMLQPRYHFQLAPFGEEGYMRLLALGGEQSSRVEWWDEELSFWQEAAVRLRAERSQAGAVTVTPEMVCTPSCKPQNCQMKGTKYLNIKREKGMYMVYHFGYTTTYYEITKV